MEEWKDIKGYEGIYQASTKGRIRRIYRTKLKPKVLKPELKKEGYHRVTLCLNNIRYREYVHRLVAMTFNSDTYKDGCEVDHINANKTDNRPENLRWLTHHNNVLIAYIRYMSKKENYTFNNDEIKTDDDMKNIIITTETGEQFKLTRYDADKQKERYREYTYKWRRKNKEYYNKYMREYMRKKSKKNKALKNDIEIA